MWKNKVGRATSLIPSYFQKEKPLGYCESAKTQKLVKIKCWHDERDKNYDRDKKAKELHPIYYLISPGNFEVMDGQFDLNCREILIRYSATRVDVA